MLVWFLCCFLPVHLVLRLELCFGFGGTRLCALVSVLNSFRPSYLLIWIMLRFRWGLMLCSGCVLVCVEICAIVCSRCYVRFPPWCVLRLCIGSVAVVMYCGCFALSLFSFVLLLLCLHVQWLLNVSFVQVRAIFTCITIFFFGFFFVPLSYSIR